MKLKMTWGRKKQISRGICPFCESDTLEENAELEKGYFTDYCYKCNAGIMITDEYAYKATVEHYQFN